MPFNSSRQKYTPVVHCNLPPPYPPMLIELSKISDKEDNNIVKETVFHVVTTKVNAVDIKLPNIKGLVSKTQYDPDIKNLEKKIENVDKRISHTIELV